MDQPDLQLDRRAAEEMLLAHLPVLQSVVAHVARRHRLGGADRDELLSMARLKLVEDDYAVVRRFSGRASFRAYLAVVVERVWLDDRAARWGRWRPSAIARRLGPLAVRLEAMLYRDRRPVGEAIQELRARGGPDSEDEVRELAGRLPPRVARHDVEEEQARDVAAPGGADAAVLDAEAAATAAAAERAIADALAAMPARDRLVLQMHFLDGTRVADIARVLGVPQKPLYGQVERSLAALRTSLERAGVSAAFVSRLLDEGRLAPHLHLVERPLREAVGKGPS